MTAFPKLPCLRGGIVMLRAKDTILFLLGGAELLGQFVAPGYENIRIDEAASVHVGQHSILIVDIGYSLVQLNDFQAPEHPPFTDCLEVVEHLLEDRLPVEPQLVVHPKEGGVDLIFCDLLHRTVVLALVMLSAYPVGLLVADGTPERCTAGTTGDFERQRVTLPFRHDDRPAVQQFFHCIEGFAVDDRGSCPCHSPRSSRRPATGGGAAGPTRS